MKREELKALADYMLEQSNVFQAYRERMVQELEARRERNVGWLVGSVAGSALGMMALQPAVTLAFTVASLAAIGNCVYHKKLMAKRMAALDERNLPVLDQMVDTHAEDAQDRLAFYRRDLVE